MKNRLVLLFIAISGLWSFITAESIPGSQIINSGSGTKEVSLGYTGISCLDSIDGITFNPASQANARRIANSLSFGGIGSGSAIGLVGVSFPMDLGVISFNAIYGANSGNNNLSSFYGGELSLAKPITENLFWGTGLKFIYGLASPSDWALALDMGVIIEEKTATKGFGIQDYSYGLVLKNIGKTIKVGDYDPFPPMGIGIGGSFYPIIFDFYKLKVSGDINLPFYPLGFSLGVGIENIIFDFLKIRGGYVLAFPENGSFSGVGPFTFGVAFTGRFKLKSEEGEEGKFQFRIGREKLENSTDFEIAYSLQQQRFRGVEEIAHFVGLNIAWGYYDEEKPKVKLTLETNYISPNFDGSQDNARIYLQIKDNKLVDGWKLEILDESRNVIRTYNSIEKLKLRSLDVVKFLKQIISTKQQVEIPEYIDWNAQDVSGKVVKDGKYFVKLTAWDENKNTAESEITPLFVDTVIPEVKVQYDSLIFSPNGDGAKEELIIRLSYKNVQEGDTLIVKIKGSDGREVKSYTYDSNYPDEIRWDGKDNNDKPVGEGEYIVSIGISDFSGNKTLLQDARITLVTNYQQVDVTSSLEVFSPNNDGIMDNVVFTTKLSDDKGLEKWVLEISDKNGKVVKKIEGKREFPQKIYWDGKGDNNRVLDDGEYYYVVKLFFDSGNHPASLSKKIVIDTTPPKIEVKPQYMSFSPNGDGKQDTVKFYHQITGNDEDVIEVKIVNQVGTIVYYNRTLLKDFEKEFEWNGLDKDFNPLPEGKYTYIVEGFDKVGNKSQFAIKDIFLKTGLEKIAVQSDVPAISPSNFKANNKATFAISLTTKSGIIDFEFKIYDKNKTIYQIKTNNYLEKIVWDGKDNEGRIVADGSYTYQIKVKYDFGDEPSSTPKEIIVDSIPPEIEILTKDYIFSPNGDGRKDNFVIRQKVKGEKTDIYNAYIYNNKGEIVRKYSFTGNVPAEIIWDGKDEIGNDLPQGIYTYKIVGVDIASNTVVKEIPQIKLVRNVETLSVSIDRNIFSPAKGEKLNFNIKASSVEDLKDSYVNIYNENGKMFNTIKIPKDVKSYTLEWNGSDEKNNPLPDGIYYAIVSYEYESGNLAQQIISNIILDSTPPSAKITISPDVFTPDGDGEDDVMYINLDLDDLTDVAEWKLLIYKKVDRKEDINPFRTFSGKGKGKTLIQWDGMSDDREDLVEAVQDYVVQLTVLDKAGNRKVIEEKFTTGVLVERTPDGLRIRVASILFEFDKATFVGDYQTPLNKIIYILRKIMSNPEKYGLGKNFQIEVSGHTDDIGAEDYNLNLSEKRAKKVYDYLVQHDIDPSILTYKGYGESRPYKIIKSDMPKAKIAEYRARNRRVEFFIRKK